MSAILGNGTVTFGDGTSLSTNPIPSSTVMLFYQSSAPTGWTQVTSLNDYDMRITSGTGGSTGGTTAYSTVFSNQTPTITTSGLSAGATTLSTSQIPSHNHDVAGYSGRVNGSNFNLFFPPNCYGSSCTFSQTGYQGGGGSHSHSISGSATSSAITLNVRYANIILCSKN